MNDRSRQDIELLGSDWVRHASAAISLYEDPARRPACPAEEHICIAEAV